MPLIVSAFASGLLFGLGLVISEMVNPAKVLAFLDVFGNWDPSLAFVMAGAVAVSALGYVIAKRRGAPVLAPRLEIPTLRVDTSDGYSPAFEAIVEFATKRHKITSEY